MSNNIIASSPNIQGNISNCEVQTIKVKTDYKPFKRTYTNTYQVINKCDNSIMSEYTEWWAWFWIWVLVILAIVVIAWLASND